MGLTPRRIAFFVAALALLATVSLPAPRTASAQSPESNPVVAEALKHVGSHGGQCYTFVQDVVRDATGRNIGSGYRHGFLQAGGVEIDPANAKAGDVLQIANPSDTHNYYPGMHTVIVMENLGNRTYKVVDSNWKWDERVRVHEWTARQASNLKLYAYRFTAGGSSGGGASVSASDSSSSNGSAPSLQAGDSAEVEPGTCLRLRGGAGLGNGIVDCLSAGTGLTVLSGPTSADGYTWVKVRTSSGEEGWVASEFLDEVASSASTSEPDPTPTSAPTTTSQSGSSASSTSSVDAPDSCLYVRAAAGLSQDIRDCLPHGTAVTVVEQGGSVEGYNWVRVEGSSGVEGWVASEYLAAD